MAVKRKIWKQGNSLVISLPDWMLEQNGIAKGDKVDVDCYPGQMITITKERERQGETVN